MNWSQKELEALFQKAKKKAMEDEAFRKEITENLKAALEKLAGAALPDDVSLKLIEKSADFAGIFTCTDIDSDELELAALGKVQGGNAECGLNVCMADYSPGPCAAFGCGGHMCSTETFECYSDTGICLTATNIDVCYPYGNPCIADA